MKHAFSKSILILLVLGLTLSSCGPDIFNQKTIRGDKEVQTETRTVRNDFTKLEKSGIIDVILTKGTQDGKLELKGEANILEYIETKVEGFTLMVQTKKGINLPTRKPLELRLSAENLIAISSAGSGDTKTQDQLKADKFKIDQAGSGDMDLELAVNRLIINTAGSGDIKLSGKVEELEVSKSGSGDIHAFGLAVKNANLSSTGSGDTQIRVKENLEVSRTGSGDLHFKGQPEIKASSTGSGEVIDAN